MKTNVWVIFHNFLIMLKSDATHELLKLLMITILRVMYSDFLCQPSKQTSAKFRAHKDFWNIIHGPEGSIHYIDTKKY